MGAKSHRIEIEYKKISYSASAEWRNLYMKGTLGLVLFLSFISIVFAGGNTYYVAPPPTGNDGNPGTSGSPFATIQHAINVSIAGDSIIVTPGTYQGARFYFKSGTAALPITLSGQAGAIVNSPGPSNSNGDNLWVRNSNYIIVEGFEVHSAPRAGIAVQADPEPDESIGVIVRNNHCHNNTRWGIFTGYAKDILIEGNETSFSGIEHGIYVSNSSDNPIIRFNHVHDNNASGIQINADPALDGDGIITNAVIDSNIIHENGIAGGAAINLASVRNSTIVNNLLYNNRASGIAGWDDGFCDDNPGACGNQYIFGTRNNKIYNNTIVMPSNGRWAITLLNGSINNEIKNNILQNAHSFRGSISVDAGSESGLNSDYNIVKNAFSNNDGNTTMTLAAWQVLGHDAHSFIPTANLYVNQANGNFHLITGSEAIDQGTPLAGVTDDLDSLSRPQGGVYDIGAYEYLQNGSSIFFDDFEDQDASNWSYMKGNWIVVNGDLTGSHTRRADIISPDFGGCSNCTVEAYLRIVNPGGRVTLLAFYGDKKNLVEIGLFQDKGKVVLKQKSGGVKVAKRSITQSLQTGVDYLVSVNFDGTSFNVSIDGNLLFSVAAGATPNGIVGFRVKTSTGAFREITVS
jgi:hypothetical protein